MSTKEEQETREKMTKTHRERKQTERDRERGETQREKTYSLTLANRARFHIVGVVCAGSQTLGTHAELVRQHIMRGTRVQILQRDSHLHKHIGPNTFLLLSALLTKVAEHSTESAKSIPKFRHGVISCLAYCENIWNGSWKFIPPCCCCRFNPSSPC